ncbi:MAG: TetR/AcrR family transcriptional regulator [Cyanobacteria bacterium P01_A01_bin.123]
MARHKTFEKEAVLEKAMDVFWHQGYEATSMQDLVAAMGINRGSLYDTFKDKRNLFLSAIAHYNQTVVEQLISRLMVPGASRQAIEDHFLNVVEYTVADSRHRGCLITNTIVELGAQDPEIAAQTKVNLQRIEDAFFRALLRAQDQREISQDKDLRALSRYFIAAMQGLRVMAKLNPDRSALQDVVDVILAALD